MGCLSDPCWRGSPQSANVRTGTHAALLRSTPPAGATTLLLGLTVPVGTVVGAWAPQGVIPIVLVYSPGGVTEMSIVALSLGIEIAFVVAHHIVRLLFELGGSGPLFALIQRICGSAGRQ